MCVQRFSVWTDSTPDGVVELEKSVLSTLFFTHLPNRKVAFPGGHTQESPPMQGYHNQAQLCNLSVLTGGA